MLMYYVLIIFLAGEDILDRLVDAAPKEPKSMNFFSKFAELQLLMLQHNAGLTASHPYASNPINWPFLLSGISFWTDNEPQKQIYLIGNIIGWWTCVVALSIYVGIIGADLLARRRGIDPIPDRKYPICWSVLVCLFIIYSCAQSSLEQHWVLRHCLGRALYAFLPHEPTTLYPPLPAIAFGVSFSSRLSFKLRSLRDYQLPDFRQGPNNACKTFDVLRSRREGSSYGCHLHFAHAHNVCLYGCFDIRNTRVSYLITMTLLHILTIPFLFQSGRRDCQQ
jgi:hypothetical protein